MAVGAWALQGGVGGAGGTPARARTDGVVAAAGVARSPNHPGGRAHPAGAPSGGAAA